MIRLSNTQIVHIEEYLIRCENNSRKIPRRIAVEELVEDILKEVLPCEDTTAKKQQNADV
jgi:hypothetical protein